MIRLATEKSLQNDLKKFKENEEFCKNWRPLLIMYQSRYEKRKSWKEKEADFEKIEKLLKEQETELNEIEKKLPAPIKIKAKKEEKKKNRPKESVVYLLDLETKTAEPFGNENAEEIEEEKIEEEKSEAEKSDEEKVESKEKSSLVRDPFFMSDRHRIQEQKRTNRQNDEEQIDDQRFIEQSFFINALSSSSNRRDGKGELARKKWAHLDMPRRTTNKSQNFNSSIRFVLFFFDKRKKTRHFLFQKRKVELRTTTKNRSIRLGKRVDKQNTLVEFNQFKRKKSFSTTVKTKIIRKTKIFLFCY